MKLKFEIKFDTESMEMNIYPINPFFWPSINNPAKRNSRKK